MIDTDGMKLVFSVALLLSSVFGIFAVAAHNQSKKESIARCVMESSAHASAKDYCETKALLEKRK